MRGVPLEAHVYARSYPGQRISSRHRLTFVAPARGGSMRSHDR